MSTIGPFGLPKSRKNFDVEVQCQSKPFAVVLGVQSYKRIDGDKGIFGECRRIVNESF